MSERKYRVRHQKQVCINVDVGIVLQQQVNRMARQLEEQVGRGRRVTRGDVVRLAIRRLLLAFYARDCEVCEGIDDALNCWHKVAEDIRIMGICPDWLVPGQGEVPVIRHLPKPKEQDP
jgi:hypothetical protein